MLFYSHIAAKNRYLNLLAILKFAKTQNELKPAETKLCNLQQPVFLYPVHSRF